MSIEQLTAILPVPSSPIAAGDAENWQYVEAKIGGILPADYKEFIAVYGVGRIDDFLWVYSPFLANKYLNLLSQKEAVLTSFRIFRDESGEELPFPLYPVQNGVFPWGCTDNGDHLCWRFRNGRLERPLVIIEGRGPEWEEFDLSMTGFLAGVLTRQIKVNMFPEEFPSKVHSFVP
jgi:hypothetical protein